VTPTYNTKQNNTYNTLMLLKKAIQALLLLAMLAVMSLAASTVSNVNVKSFGSNVDDYSFSSFDSQGNLVVVTILPAGKQYNILNVNFAATTTNSLIVIKVDSSLSNIVWYKRYPDINLVKQIHVDSMNNIYIVGTFTADSMNFNSELAYLNKRTSGLSIVFLKMNGSGQLQWANQFNTLATESQIDFSISVDSNGNVDMSGYFRYLLTTGAPGVTVQGYTSVLNRQLGEEYRNYAFQIGYSSDGSNTYVSSRGYPTSEAYFDHYEYTGNVHDSQNNLYIAEQFKIKTEQRDRGTIRKNDQQLLALSSPDGNIGTGAVNIDKNDNLYFLVSTYGSSITIQGPQQSVTKNVAHPTMFIVKVASDGTIVWATDLGIIKPIVFVVDSSLDVYLKELSSATISKVSKDGVLEWTDIVIIGDVTQFNNKPSFYNGKLAIGGSFAGTITPKSGPRISSSIGSRDALFGTVQVVDSNDSIQNVCPSGMVCAQACCEWKPVGTNSFVQTCYTQDIYRCATDKADGAKKCLCPIGTDCCAGACFNPSVHVCTGGSLCPVGTERCGQSCYNTNVFKCCGGTVLKPVGQAC
jgi:hypothetical protein